MEFRILIPGGARPAWTREMDSGQARRPVLLAQGVHRVEAGGAAGRKIAGGGGD